MTRRLLLRAGRGALVFAGATLIALAVLTLGARLALPFAAGWKAEIENGLADFLGRPVGIESLALRWRGTGPELRAQGVSVAEDELRRISVDEALIDLDLASSLLRRSLVFDELTLVGAALTLERDAAGAWSVQAGGVPRHQAVASGSVPSEVGVPAEGGRGLDGLRWLFDARRVGLLGTRLTLVDVNAGTLLALDAVDLRVENDGGTHRMRVATSLPEALGGGDVELGIDLDSGMRGAVERRATGDFYARGQALRPAALHRVVAALGGGDTDGIAATLEAEVAVEAWGTLAAGRLQSARARIEATAVRAPSDGPDLLDALDATVRFVSEGPDAEGWSLVADGAGAALGTERATLDVLRLARTSASGPLLLTASGARLPVALAAAVPLALADAPAGLEPRGSVSDWSTEIRLGEGLRGLDLEATISDLTTRAAGGLPGVDALDMGIELRRGRGRVTLASAGAGPLSVDAPHVDADPFRLDALDVRVDVAPTSAEGGVSLRGPLALKSGGLELSSRVALGLSPDRSPRVDIDGRFSMANVAGVADLLPDRLLGPATVSWFASALRAGRASNGELRVSGRLADFPFTRHPGAFRASVDVSDTELNWLDGWPVARGLAGSVRLDGLSLSGRMDEGEADGLALGSASWRIADLRRPSVALTLSGRAPLPDMLSFANAGPLRELLRPALGDVVGTGGAGLDLNVVVPLTSAVADDTPFAVDGAVFLAGNDVRFGTADLDLRGAVGAVRFDLDGLEAHRLRADWLGRPLVLGVRMEGEGASRRARVTARGALEARDVLAHYALPLDGFVSGASDWRAELVVPFDAAALRARGVRLSARSELVGTALELPAPLGKSSATPRAFTLATAFRPDDASARWSVRAGDGLVAHADVGPEGMTALALGLGGVEASEAGAPGVRIDGRLAVLSLDGWAESLGTLIDAMPASEGPPEPTLPVSGSLDVGGLRLFGAPLGPARLRLNSDADYLNAALDNALLDGNARWPRLEGGGLPARVRLAKVDGRVVDALLDADEADAASGAEDDAGSAGIDPRALPPIEARIVSLGWREATLDNVVLRASRDVAGLRIDTLGFTHESLQLLGEGYWRMADPEDPGDGSPGVQRTALSLTLQSPDFGRGLADIGLPDLLTGGAGRATARIGWAGPAWSPALERLGGALQFDLTDGSIVPLDPGAGKLIGLLAFQALPRRLDFDFSDVTDDGLAFSRVSGRAGIEDGIITAPLVQLTGPVGVVDVSGTTDLMAGTLDQRVTVLPRVSAALPIIGAIAGGASAGVGAVGALLAGGVLKAMGVDFDRLGLREYALTGSWDDPAFEPL